MTANIHTRTWRRTRANWQHTINTTTTHCWRCGNPIPPHTPTAWDLGHKTDRHHGGTNNPTNLAPECARNCNRSAGGHLGAAITNQPTPTPSRAL